MRGKGIDVDVMRAVGRITPAYAGKRQEQKAASAKKRDHPRVCGEKLEPLRWQAVTAGSPPHMRGKASESYQKITECQDHPRICGEKNSIDVFQRDHWGSPPHMRGKVSTAKVLSMFSGITPAYAGKRKIWNEWFRDEKDHPRICGEKVIETGDRSTILGSPPHMRGKA